MKPSAALKISALLTLLATSVAHTCAQESFKPGGEHGGVRAEAQGVLTPEAQLRLRARGLAASTADEALKWDDTQAAVRVLSQAADLLWADDPERSRAWLMRAWELAGSAPAENADSRLRRYRSNSPQSQARAAVLAVAQKHDRQLADRLLAQLADEGESSGQDSRRGIFDDLTARSEQLLRMALTLAESDPAASAELAVKSLTDGVSFQLQGILLALRGRDRGAANRVFDAALNRLAADFRHPSEGLILASYLFTPGRVVGSGREGGMALAVGTRTAVPQGAPAAEEPARTRRFLAVMQRVLLSMPAPSTTANPAQAAHEFITLSGSLTHGFKLYAPELWLPIEHRLVQVAADLAPARADQRTAASVRERLSAGAAAGADEKEFHRLYVEGLEEAAEKEANPTSRKLAYVQAALATTPDELESGLKLAAKITEGSLREQVVSLLAYRAALLKLERGLHDEAVKLAAEAGPLQRAIILITAAQRIAAERLPRPDEQALNRRLRALDLLSEARKLLERDDLPGAALRVRLGLVAALAPLDAAQGLEAFGKVVAAINNDPSFDASDASAPHVADLAGSADPSLPRIRSGYGFRDAVTPLARADFEGSAMAAARLSAPAVRGTCLLEIARSILSEDPAK